MEFWGGYLIGATLAGVPFFALLFWLVGLFAFRRRTPIERATLIPGSTYLVMSALWLWNGNSAYILTTLPSVLIVTGIWVYLVKRRERTQQQSQD
jgi:hypothetical protein